MYRTAAICSPFAIATRIRTQEMRHLNGDLAGVNRIVNKTFSITQDAYTKFALNFPIDFESSIVAYGRTSVVRQVTLADGETGRVFGTNLQK